MYFEDHSVDEVFDISQPTQTFAKFRYPLQPQEKRAEKLHINRHEEARGVVNEISGLVKEED